MARKYTRDNRGRFASRGSGATARGGRLKTAAGNKRKTQTMKAAGAGGAGVIKGAVKRDPMAAGKIGKAKRPSAATSKLRPGELMNAIARPRNVMAKYQKEKSPFYPFSVRDTRNVQTAKAIAERQGVKVVDWSKDFRAGNAPAVGKFGKSEISLNPSASFWENPAKRSRDMRRVGMAASSAPSYMIHHEIGHTKHSANTTSVERYGKYAGKKGRIASSMEWGRARNAGPGQTLSTGIKTKALAGRVSGYAKTNPPEFVAEVYAGLKTGRKYDKEVMQAYRELKGLTPKPAARRRSRLK